MSLRKSIARLLLPILAPPRHGVWLEGIAKRDGVYIFLFGRSAESIALLFPPPPNKGPLPIFITEDSTAEQRLIERGHVAVNVGAFRVMDEKQASRYMQFMTFALFALYRPVRVLLTPEFDHVAPRARITIKRLLDFMLEKDMEPLHPRLGFIVPEATVEVRPTEQVIKTLGQNRGLDGMLHFYAFGSPDYFDFEMAFEQKPAADIQWLGWRSEFPAPSSRGAPPDLNVMFLDPRLASAVVAKLEQMPNRSAWGAIRRISLAEPSFEEAMTRPGLYLSDGRSDLLPLLAAKRPVTLVWDPRADRPTLIRVSYFLGSKRWPVFESVDEMIDAVGRQTLEDFWKPFENRKCSLEESAYGDLATGIAKLFEPGPVTVAEPV